MGAKRIELIEKNVERFAAASLAAAIGYAVLGLSALPQPEAGICAAVAAAITFHLCRNWFAARAEKDRIFAVPVFDVREIEMLDDELLLTDLDRVGSTELVLTDSDRLAADELLLTDADRVAAPVETLELDDILAELGPDSRVVRLFDRKAMPTPGQRKSRIDTHLEHRAEPVHSDAAQALSDALAELRRSLRR